MPCICYGATSGKEDYDRFINSPKGQEVMNHITKAASIIMSHESEARIFHSWWDNTSSTGDWYDIQNSWIIEDVTHWMPLPESPND